jgi:two-component system nitrogen regulation response regulator NtrX
MHLEHNRQIYIVDDDKNIRRSLQVSLQNLNYATHVYENPIVAFNDLKKKAPDILILDVKLGDISGIDLFRKLLTEGIDVPVIFMSAHATTSEAVSAVQMGAFDFLEKPFSVEKLAITIERCLELRSAKKLITELKSKTEDVEFIGHSKAFGDLMANIDKVAPTNSPVLITGESGTGKELIAREIHRRSKFANNAFIKVNCSAIPENLIESELFGYVKGAFTGAEKSKRGYFELADNGTLFLDEIGEMSLSAQAKVLRAIQNMEIQKLGSEHVYSIKVRIICATNRDLKKDIKSKTFREDLYYRINVFPIYSPALRERKSDIPLLVEYFLREYVRINMIPDKFISPNVMDKIKNYQWPGNIRELKNIVERMAILSGQTIEEKHLPNLEQITADKGNEDILPLKEYRNKVERSYILTVLKKTGGNISDAAFLLNVERTYLHKKISQFEIKKKEYFI